MYIILLYRKTTAVEYFGKMTFSDEEVFPELELQLGVERSHFNLYQTRCILFSVL